jgi:hypothetical protein
MMASSVQRPVEGVVATYEGVYLPHWEVGHIAVRVSRSRKLLGIACIALGLCAVYVLGYLNQIELIWVFAFLAWIAATPAKERWNPQFPPDCDVGLDHEGGAIRFEGIVSPRGRYGHLGFMRRTVTVVRVLKYKHIELCTEAGVRPAQSLTPG